jgi:nucleoside-diphosphate-sugar epimerase
MFVKWSPSILLSIKNDCQMITLVTGANGLVGLALCSKLQQNALLFRRAVRVPSAQPVDNEVAVGDITSHTDWQLALVNVQQVVHCAARVHVMNDPSPDPLLEFRRVNVDGTVNLARQAAAAGVKRFVFPKPRQK